ncbi:MAG TPA: hypothetical protein VML55_16095 [Planctomycetaceae bacterium]|nr:hypothetical protein [Planctomycetaceae bacterium]
MRARRREQQFNLNFDGLTDSVTNLVGALILLVLLIIGISREALSEDKPPPSPQPPEIGQKSIIPLQHRVTLLQSQVHAVDVEITALDVRMNTLRDEIDELLRKVEQVKPPAPADEPRPEPETETRTEKFRPPLERVVEKEDVAFVVQNECLSLVDWDSLNQQIRSQLQGTGPFEIELTGMDFRVTRHADDRLLLIRRPGSLGEPIERAESPASRFLSRLEMLDREKYAVRFLVYPDSFEAFRRARAVAWTKGFEVGWSPQAPGSDIELGAGARGSTIVD